MRRHFAAIVALAVAFAFLGWGCGGDDSSTSKPDKKDAGSDAADAGGDVESDGAACNTLGVSKRPWTIHVDETSALVRWEACSQSASPDLVFSPESGGAGEQTITANITPTTIPNTYTAPLNGKATPDYAGTFYLHEAALTGLTSGSCYKYSLVADSTLTGRFCTARPSGDSFKILAVGDTNPGLGTTPKMLEQVANENYEVILHEGDIQYYASGLETWQSWFQLMSPMLAQGAFLPSVGNHEAEKPDEFALYYTRFFDKAGFDGKNGNFRAHSGGVWFFALNTEESLDAGSEQVTWFEAQLKDAASKPGYRFSIVFFHRPFLTCGDTSQKDDERALLQPLFEQYQVPVVLQGHMHGYERFEVPVGDAGKTITYLTVAGGGGALGDVDQNISLPTCSMRVSSGAFYHLEIIEIAATSVSGRTIDDKGTVRDTWTKSLPW